jgi:hypothetical protein
MEEVRARVRRVLHSVRSSAETRLSMRHECRPQSTLYTEDALANTKEAEGYETEGRLHTREYFCHIQL